MRISSNTRHSKHCTFVQKGFGSSDLRHNRCMRMSEIALKPAGQEGYDPPTHNRWRVRLRFTAWALLVALLFAVVSEKAQADEAQSGATANAPTAQQSPVCDGIARSPTIPLPPPNPEVAAAAPMTYVVQPGDTLSEIAKRFGTPQDELVWLNSIRNPDIIFEGQELELPPTVGVAFRMSQPPPRPTGPTRLPCGPAPSFPCIQACGSGWLDCMASGRDTSDCNNERESCLVFECESVPTPGTPCVPPPPTEPAP